MSKKKPPPPSRRGPEQKAKPKVAVAPPPPPHKTVPSPPPSSAKRVAKVSPPPAPARPRSVRPPKFVEPRIVEAPPPSQEAAPSSQETPPEYDGADLAEISAYIDLPTDDALGDDMARDTLRDPRQDFVEKASRGEDVGGELRAVEEELERILHGAGQHGRKPEDRGLAGDAVAGAFRVVEALREAIPVELPGEQGGTLADAAKDVLSTDYYLRQWGRLGLRNRSEEVDEFGLDPVYEARVRPFFEALYKYWFRVEVTGLEHVPEDGRCILVGNHSGVLPYDGIMVRTAVRKAHPAAREVRWLAEDFVYHLPFLGAFMNRIGAVRACPENAERLLEGERCILVFPEGIKGIGKLWKDRYQLQRFGRGGFVKLALRTGAPIVPVAIVGAEESAPMLYKLEYLTEAFGLPFMPVTPGLPLFGPLGLIPAPTKWKITFLPPVDLKGSGPSAADDALLVNRLAERVRGTIQESLDRQISTRKSVFFG